MVSGKTNKLEVPVNLELSTIISGSYKYTYLTWSAEENASEYKIYRGLSSESSYMYLYTTTADTKILVHTAGGITTADERPEVTYYYKVSYCNSETESEMSDEYCSFTADRGWAVYN